MIHIGCSVGKLAAACRRRSVRFATWRRTCERLRIDPEPRHGSRPAARCRGADQPGSLAGRRHPRTAVAGWPTPQGRAWAGWTVSRLWLESPSDIRAHAAPVGGQLPTPGGWSTSRPAWPTPWPSSPAMGGCRCSVASGCTPAARGATTSPARRTSRATWTSPRRSSMDWSGGHSGPRAPTRSTFPPDSGSASGGSTPVPLCARSCSCCWPLAAVTALAVSTRCCARSC